ncbi:hypothetical protein D3C77_262030 [compost metagenome]
MAVALLLRIARRSHSRLARHCLAGADAHRLVDQLPGAEHGVAAKAQVAAIAGTQAVDVVVTNLADQGQTIATQHLIEKARRGSLRLQHRHAFVAIELGTGQVD